MTKIDPFMAAILMVVLGSALLGASPVFVRYSDLGPLTTGFYRMVFAIPLLFLWANWDRRKINRAPAVKTSYLLIALAGLLFATDVALWNISIDYTAIVNSTLFNNTAAFFVPIIMWVVFKERQSKRFVSGLSVGIIGSVLLFQESMQMSMETLFGDFLALMAGLSFSLYVIAIKRITINGGTGKLMLYMAFPTTFGLLLYGLLFGESFYPLTFRDLISVFGQAVVVHVLGQGLIVAGMEKIPASYGSLILLLTPVTAAILAWAVYGETLTITKTIGVIMILSSIVIVKGDK